MKAKDIIGNVLEKGDLVCVFMGEIQSIGIVTEIVEPYIVAGPHQRPIGTVKIQLHELTLPYAPEAQRLQNVICVRRPPKPTEQT